MAFLEVGPRLFWGVNLVKKVVLDSVLLLSLWRARARPLSPAPFLTACLFLFCVSG